NKVDRTYSEAIVQNGTNAVMTTVAGDEYSIGYISLGSLNDTVKAVKVNEVEATAENILNNSYEVARPFNVAYKEDLSPLAKDFFDFILSADGQKIVVEEGYVQVDTEAPSYEGDGTQSGTLVAAGSTSVSPLMEKLVEEYQKLNPEASIEIQSTGSSAGMQSAMEGTADIGMASRELKDSELAELTPIVIALDGIAIIVNNNNTLDNLSIDDVKSIYIGETTKWNDIK
ncbi:substrate-binding domain-containing protein, partial [Schnuerera sp.]|uniref:substrate-binding domain-containing protein n=1 Tax=Schnuerera sp. TaxID=2794844 RepID=UPI002CD2E613